MFHNSSHKRFWIFKREDEVEHMRSKANQKFRNKIKESGKVSSSHSNVKLSIPDFIFSVDLWFPLLYGLISLEWMTPYFWSGTKKTFYSDTTRGECWISVTHLNQQCPNLLWYVCFLRLWITSYMGILRYMCWRVSELCQGTAIMYFRRFYLNNSIMEYHPRIIMYGLLGVLMFDCHNNVNCY